MAQMRDGTKSVIFQKWELFKEASRACVYRNISIMFSAIKENVCLQLAEDTSRFSRLGSGDEEIYTHLTELMNVYHRVVELVSAINTESPSVRALADEIGEVLSLRLNEFGERAETNPITHEKNSVVERSAAFLARHIEDQERLFSMGLRSDISHEWDESFQILLQGECYEAFTHYREALRLALSQLEDLQTRKATKFYMELIEREREELAKIIRIRLHALEESIRNGPPELQIKVVTISDTLNKTYQEIELLIDNFQKILQLPPLRPVPFRPFNEFEAAINEALGTVSLPCDDGGEFFAELSKEADTHIVKLGTEYMRAAYRLQRIVSGAVLLSEEITQSFEKLLKSLSGIKPDDVDTSQLTEKDILSGIIETIEIKVDSLKESTKDFYKQGLDMVRLLAVEKINIPRDELINVYEDVRRCWVEATPDETGLDKFLNSCPAFLPYREKMAKHVDSYFEKAEKSILRLKKEVILYEICTYEEILTHSVSRLRNSENEQIMAAAEILDETFKSLEIILRKNNIAVIRPNPGDSFDAREHEVLVAEKHEDFGRGEIVKVLTCGYRQDKTVILRANVIAAR